MNVAEAIIGCDVVRREEPPFPWDGIVDVAGVKPKLLNNAVLMLTVRARLPFEVTSAHGLALLYGPPGTGKTTLARGLAWELAGVVEGGQVRLIEVDPHGLMSAEHGQSQSRVMELLAEHIPALSADRAFAGRGDHAGERASRPPVSSLRGERSSRSVT